jgi:hypothetical protein
MYKRWEMLVLPTDPAVAGISRLRNDWVFVSFESGEVHRSDRLNNINPSPLCGGG